jgi:hypothetical protein
MEWYKRPGGAVGDSLTEIGALALIGNYDCKSHIEACQSPDGRMFRHPEMKERHEMCCAGTATCGEHGGTMSRDHTVSLINYTIFSKDKEPLRKFFWFTIRNFGRHSGGSIGQSMQNVNSYASMLLALGGAYYIFGLLLSFLTIPALYLAAKKLEIGYRVILAAEFALIYYMTYPKFLTPILRCIPRMCYKRQPSNLYYEVVTAIIDGRDPAYLAPMATTYAWRQQMSGIDDLWLWSDTDGNRKGTGVDVAYIQKLIGGKVPP